jgi:hypothetical protein
VTRFTALCQSELELSTTEKSAREQLHVCESSVENAQNLYDATLRERYQEEILLGERNKGISNILTWGLLILNTCIFIYSQVVTEPKRLHKIETKIAHKVDVLLEPLLDIQRKIHTLPARMIEADKSNAKLLVDNISTTSESSRAVQHNMPSTDSTLENERMGLACLVTASSVAILMMACKS